MGNHAVKLRTDPMPSRRSPTYGNRTERIRAYVAAYPGALARDIASAVRCEVGEARKILNALRFRNELAQVDAGLVDGRAVSRWYTPAAVPVGAVVVTRARRVSDGDGDSPFDRTRRELEAEHGPIAGWSATIHAWQTERMRELAGIP